MTLGNKLLILSHEPCVDAMLHTKADAIPLIAGLVRMSLDDFVAQTAVMDDGDTTFLTDPAWSKNYKLITAPANAKEKVKAAVAAQRNGIVVDSDAYDGFRIAYEHAASLGAKFFVTDRDGVLRRDNAEYGDRFFSEIGRSMGQHNRPTVIVLTGSSYEQNAVPREDPKTGEIGPSFIEAYGFNRAAREHVATPYLVVAENGGIAINVFDVLKTESLVRRHNPEMSHRLMNQFREAVLDRVDEIGDKFSFGHSAHENDQDGKIYVPPKLSMVTVNVPRTVNGAKWRTTHESDEYRRQVFDVMVRTATMLRMPYEIVGAPPRRKAA